MTLREWQQRLQVHFEELRKRRSSTDGDDKPLFGLEHGLAAPEIQALQLAVRAHVADYRPSKDHALPWIVYACEIGYGYSGDEYWQTFEDSTPGWQINGERSWLRDRFRWFQKQFGGAEPSGAWADHFSIICWPITHAILPRDLQRQLAEILYYMRDLFTADLLRSPRALGEQIAARSWYATSRFQNLTEEPLLLGQIAAALLLQREQGDEGLILPVTLKRIGEDLDRVRVAREWLRGAQSVAQQRIQLRGLSAGRSVTDVQPSSGDRPVLERIAVEPQLLLRPAGPDAWDVLIEIPDLSPLTVRFPGLRSILADSRCIVAGSSGRPLARGALLHGTQQVLLRTWPNPNDVLLRFEQPIPPEFNARLRADCLLRPGPKWLFRIASDGLAHELRHHLVRPGNNYVIANTSGPVKRAGIAEVVTLNCTGIFGARLDLPGAISHEWGAHLETLGVSQSRSVHVWPAGLAAAAWDGEGRGEWLASEHACVGIRIDHSIKHVVLSLDGHETERLDVPFPAPGVPLFVELPRLPVGVHKLRVSLNDADHAADEESGELDVVIREPRPWAPLVGQQSALTVDVDPIHPTLEQLWEERASIDIRGPARRTVKMIVSLFAKRADDPLVRKTLPALCLPVAAATWREHFDKHFRQVPAVEKAYDLAHACTVEIDGEELGAFFLRCERDFSPVRWVVRRDGNVYSLVLLDDSGAESPPDIEHYDFVTPDVAVQHDATLFTKPWEVPAPGGIYVARRAEHQAGVIVPPAVRTPGDLTCNPKLSSRGRTPQALQELLSLMNLWSNARITGEILSALRQRQVLQAITRHLFAVIGGESWERAERSFSAGPENIAELKRAVSSKPDEKGLAVKLQEEYPRLTGVVACERIPRFSSLAKSFLHLQVPGDAVSRGPGVMLIRRHIVNDPAHPDWLAELALRLASSPQGVVGWAGDHLSAGLERLLAIPTLARAARFLVLAVDRHLANQPLEAGRLYTGWEWK